jgi:hypothetical protein
MNRSNDSNLKEILEEARRRYQKGKSVLINVLIGKTNFREGSISV